MWCKIRTMGPYQLHLFQGESTPGKAIYLKGHLIIGVITNSIYNDRLGAQHAHK